MCVYPNSNVVVGQILLVVLLPSCLPSPTPRLPSACIPISNQKFRFLPPKPILTLHQNMILLVNTQVQQFQLQSCANTNRTRYFGRSVRLTNCGHIDPGNRRVRYEICKNNYFIFVCTCFTVYVRQFVQNWTLYFCELPKTTGKDFWLQAKKN